LRLPEIDAALARATLEAAPAVPLIERDSCDEEVDLKEQIAAAVVALYEGLAREGSARRLRPAIGTLWCSETSILLLDDEEQAWLLALDLP
jgi:hypothetical protein